MKLTGDDAYGEEILKRLGENIVKEIRLRETKKED
jgi:hypothetical protein